jgi:hypothetical protein
MRGEWYVSTVAWLIDIERHLTQMRVSLRPSDLMRVVDGLVIVSAPQALYNGYFMPFVEVVRLHYRRTIFDPAMRRMAVSTGTDDATTAAATTCSGAH